MSFVCSYNREHRFMPVRFCSVRTFSGQTSWPCQIIKTPWVASPGGAEYLRLRRSGQPPTQADIPTPPRQGPIPNPSASTKLIQQQEGTSCESAGGIRNPGTSDDEMHSRQPNFACGRIARAKMQKSTPRARLRATRREICKRTGGAICRQACASPSQ